VAAACGKVRSEVPAMKWRGGERLRGSWVWRGGHASVCPAMQHRARRRGSDFRTFRHTSPFL